MSKAEAERLGAKQVGNKWYLDGKVVRTGSTRHDEDDHGHVHTADFVLVKNGEPVTPVDDPVLYEAFFEEAAATGWFPGMGHYSWGIHVGHGHGARQPFSSPDSGS